MSALPASPLCWIAANELPKKLLTVPTVLVFCLLIQEFVSRFTDDNCSHHTSNTAHELAKIINLW